MAAAPLNPTTMMPLPRPVSASAVLPSSSPAAPGTLIPNSDECCTVAGAASARVRAAFEASGSSSTPGCLRPRGAAQATQTKRWQFLHPRVGFARNAAWRRLCASPAAGPSAGTPRAWRSKVRGEALPSSSEPRGEAEPVPWSGVLGVSSEPRRCSPLGEPLRGGGACGELAACESVACGAGGGRGGASADTPSVALGASSGAESSSPCAGAITARCSVRPTARSERVSCAGRPLSLAASVLAASWRARRLSAETRRHA
jgi:hypothetical protein